MKHTLPTPMQVPIITYSITHSVLHSPLSAPHPSAPLPSSPLSPLRQKRRPKIPHCDLLARPARPPPRIHSVSQSGRRIPLPPHPDAATQRVQAKSPPLESHVVFVPWWRGRPLPARGGSLSRDLIWRHVIWIYPLGTLTGYRMYPRDDSFVEIGGGTVDGGGNLRGRSWVGFPSGLFLVMAGETPVGPPRKVAKWRPPWVF